MDLRLLDSLRELQGLIRTSGLGGTVVALHDSRLSDDRDVDPGLNRARFSQVIFEDEIVEVSRDLFESGFFSQAVDEAFKALGDLIQKRSGVLDHSGEKLVRLVFSPDEPKLIWSDRVVRWQQDEQKGYFYLLSGGFIGIQNALRARSGYIADQESALEAIILAQHLMVKVKNSRRAPGPIESTM